MILQHAPNIQILDPYRLVFAAETRRQLMEKVMTNALDTTMPACQPANGLAPVGRAFLLTAHTALLPPQSTQISPQRLRAVYLLTRRQRGQGGHPQVDADGSVGASG